MSALGDGFGITTPWGGPLSPSRHRKRSGISQFSEEPAPARRARIEWQNLENGERVAVVHGDISESAIESLKNYGADAVVVLP